MEQSEFLSRQFDLLSNRVNDPTIEWQDIADLRSEYAGEVEHRDTVRKGAKIFYEYLNAGWIRNPDEVVNTPTKVSSQIRELQKERYKLQTEKLEVNRWLRENARDELIVEHICQEINRMEPLKVPSVIPVDYTDIDRSYCLVFGDEHFGVEFELKDLAGNVINSYSPDVFKKRMWTLLNKVIKIIEKESIKTLHIFNMGDFSDGCLRTSQLMKLRCGVVDGTINYAHFIATWLNELSKYVHIVFQMTDGNHSELRLLGQPKGSFKEDNMGKIVREFIKIRLHENQNFEYIENPTGYIYAELSSYVCLGIHGETRNMERALKDFSHIYHVPISYLLAGHLHHTKIEEIGSCSEVINIPSIVGTDPYALSLNKFSDPAGKLLVFEKGNGKICEYTIKVGDACV